MCPGEEFGRWRRAAFGEAVVEGGEERERGGRDRRDRRDRRDGGTFGESDGLGEE